MDAIGGLYNDVYYITIQFNNSKMATLFVRKAGRKCQMFVRKPAYLING